MIQFLNFSPLPSLKYPTFLFWHVNFPLFISLIHIATWTVRIRTEGWGLWLKARKENKHFLMGRKVSFDLSCNRKFHPFVYMHTGGPRISWHLAIVLCWVKIIKVIENYILSLHCSISASCGQTLGPYYIWLHVFLLVKLGENALISARPLSLSVCSCSTTFHPEWRKPFHICGLLVSVYGKPTRRWDFSGSRLFFSALIFQGRSYNENTLFLIKM